MFESITEKFQDVFRGLTGQDRLSEDNIKDAVRAIKRALLEADVNLKITKQFVDSVRDKAVGADVLKGVNPTQQFIKIVNDELVSLMTGGVATQLKVTAKPFIILMAGLQGAGKTTTCAKLARLLRKNHELKPLLVAADLQRPAAVEQLKVLGKQIGVDVYAEEGSTPRKVCSNALEFAKKNGNDLIILDTAGRLHVDDELMREVSDIARLTKPHEVLLVCDSMTGQDAVKSAKAFDEQLPLTGVILTKMDGDARGGAALTVKAITGKPIRFIGVGEKIEQLEEFHADRMASRILGMGDVVSLVERAQEVIDEKQALKMEQKLLTDEFSLEDFLEQIEAIQRMGPMRDLLKMIPGAAQLPLDQFNERSILHIKAIIQSMTVRERRFPDQLNNSRKLRICKGSGRSVDEVNRLLKSFNQMRQVVKAMAGSGLMGKVASFGMKRQKTKRLRNEQKAAQKSGKRQRPMMAPGQLPAPTKGMSPQELSEFRRKFKI